MKAFIKNPGSFPIFMIFAVAVAAGSFFTFSLDHPVIQDDDAGQYDIIGRNLAQGRGFSLERSAPYSPTMLREPVYPFFLSLIYRVFGYSLAMVQAFQIFIFAVTCVLTYMIAYTLFGSKVALSSALLTSLSPALANYPSYILSEALFTFLLCLAILFLTIAIKERKNPWFLISGVIVGLAILCKAVMALFFIMVLLGIFLSDTRRPNAFKRNAVSFIIFMVPLLIIVGSWSYRNHSLFKTYQISLRGGSALWERSLKSDDSLKEMGQALAFNFSEYLGSKLFPGSAENPRDFILSGSKRSFAKESELAREGFSPVEADKMMRREAVKKLWKHPIKFLAYIPIESVKMTAFMYIPTLNEPHIIAVFEKLKQGRALLALIRGAVRMSAYPILILALFGMFSERSSWRRWYFLLAAIIYVNLIYSMIFAMGRYAVALTSFYMIFAMVGLFRILNGRFQNNV